MKIKALVVAALAGLALAGCTSITPVSAGSGVPGKKVGEASHAVILGVFHLNGGDSSMKTACANAGITKIGTVDKKVFSILGVYSKVTTIVTGE